PRRLPQSMTQKMRDRMMPSLLPGNSNRALNSRSGGHALVVGAMLNEDVACLVLPILGPDDDDRLAFLHILRVFLSIRLRQAHGDEGAGERADRRAGGAT